MRLCVPVLFLTLVLTLTTAWAAPESDQAPTPLENPLRRQDVPEQSLDPAVRENLDWPAVAPLTPLEKQEAFSEESSRPVYNWSLRAVVFNGAVSETNSSLQSALLGLRGDFMQTGAGTWQAEAAISSSNLIHLTLAQKRYFLESPLALTYYRFGIGELIDSSDGLGSVLNIKKIQALASAGWDDLLWLHRRLQGELGIGYALVGMQLEASVGFAF